MIHGIKKYRGGNVLIIISNELVCLILMTFFFIKMCM